MNEQIHNIKSKRVHLQKMEKALVESMNKLCLIESQMRELLGVKQSSIIPIKGNYKIDFIPINEIHYCKAIQSYTEVKSERHDIILSTRPITEFEILLETYPFFKINKSVLINMYKIQTFDKKSNMIIMSDNTSFELARRRKLDFLSLIKDIY